MSLKLTHKGNELCNKLAVVVLIDFTLTVKAATLIFIYGRDSAIFYLLKKENLFLFIIW